MIKNKFQIRKLYKLGTGEGDTMINVNNEINETIMFTGDDGKGYVDARGLALANAKYHRRMNPPKVEKTILKNEPIKEIYTPNNLKKLN